MCDHKFLIPGNSLSFMLGALTGILHNTEWFNTEHLVLIVGATVIFFIALNVPKIFNGSRSVRL